jgi:2-polyprenyl-6-methoxyphenol hydroxylase-like FAD-dependent oxidoreductase
MANRLGEHAVVIGGSLAGLMSARVLADYFDSVTVLERDQIDSGPAVHKSIPHGNHAHGLLVGGQRVMASLYPNLFTKLDALGSVHCRLGKEFVFYSSDGKRYSFGPNVAEPRDLGLDFYEQSRGLLEHWVRQSTLEYSNVRFESDRPVQRLMSSHGRINGVQYKENRDLNTLAADLVVDAGGRGSHAARWLAELGFEPPSETSIGVDLAYTSCRFRIPDDADRSERLLVFDFARPDCPNCAIMQIIEDDTWLLSLQGRFGDYPPADEAGFVAFAKSLHTPRLYELIKDAERISDIMTFHYPFAVRRHYERLRGFPDGFVVLGDAVTSFNPVYGQGMSVAALQIGALQQLLAERTDCAGLPGLARSFFVKAADIANHAWQMASDVDLAYPQTRGERPADLKERQAYFAALDALCAEDIEVHRLVFEVFCLCKPLSVLNEEPLHSRVLSEQRRHPDRYGL